MAIRDLRDYLDTLEKEEELVRVKSEVDWNLEIGGMLREICDTQSPAALLENIKDYKESKTKIVWANKKPYILNGD